jgi:hypothetical protein
MTLVIDIAAIALRTTTLFELHGRALDAPKGTKHAAIARQWPKQLVTPLALVEEHARVGWHFFLCGEAAFGACDDGVQGYFHGVPYDV